MVSRQNSKLMQELIEQLAQQRIITLERVANAMMKVDRYYYCHHFPYVDHHQDIGYKAIICAPRIHALILEILSDKLIPGAKVLDVGSGSGYLTACMAILVGKRGLVVGIDHIPELVEQSVKNVKKGNPELFGMGNIKFMNGDGRLGVPELAPFDVIYVGASVNRIPRELVKQLKFGGRMLVPFNTEKQKLVQIDKTYFGKVEKTNILQISMKYPPLTDKIKQWPWNPETKLIDIKENTNEDLED